MAVQFRHLPPLTKIKQVTAQSSFDSAPLTGQHCKTTDSVHFSGSDLPDDPLQIPLLKPRPLQEVLENYIRDLEIKPLPHTDGFNTFSIGYEPLLQGDDRFVIRNGHVPNPYCTIYRTPDGLEIEDAGQGVTFVDGVQIQARVSLLPGARLKVNQETFTIPDYDQNGFFRH